MASTGASVVFRRVGGREVREVGGELGLPFDQTRPGAQPDLTRPRSHAPKIQSVAEHTNAFQYKIGLL